MTALIADPRVAERIIAERRARGWDRKDEVWDGVHIIMPDPNVQHRELVSNLVGAFRDVIHPPQGGKVYPGLNPSDQIVDWTFNYRCPDVAVFLSANTAQVFEAHICGPADFLVEIVGPDDKSRDKLEFYAELGVRELKVIDRYPWSLELYRHNGHELVLIGRSSEERHEVISSEVLPVGFQLLPAGAGTDRAPRSGRLAGRGRKSALRKSVESGSGPHRLIPCRCPHNRPKTRCRPLFSYPPDVNIGTSPLA